MKNYKEFDKGGIFGMITAFRGDYSLQQNRKRNTKLMGEIRTAGFGYWVIDGAWQERNDDGTIEVVSEETLFVSAPIKGMSEKEVEKEGQRLFSFLISMAKKYDQDGFVYKVNPKSNDVMLYIHKELQNGVRKVVNQKINIGKFNANKIADNFSKIQKSGRTFVFEGIISSSDDMKLQDWGSSIVYNYTKKK